MTEAGLAFAKSAEIGVFCLAVFLFFRQRAYAISEAAVYAIFTVLLTLLVVIQFSMRLGTPGIFLFAEVAALFISLCLLYRHRMAITEVKNSAIELLHYHPWLISLFCFFLIFIGILSVINDPGIEAETPLIQFPLWYAGYDALGLMNKFYRSSGQAWDIGFFSYLAFLSIGFSTYSLARRHAWPETAIVVTMIVLSLPRVVYLSISPGIELLSCAMGLFGILCLYRTIEKPAMENLLFLLSAITVGLCGRLYMVCFSSLLVLLCCLSLYRRHGGAIWIDLIKSNRWSLFVLIFVIFLTAFAMMPVQGPVSDASLPVVSSEPFNEDGIQGTAANGIRYLVTFLNPGQPLDTLFEFFLDRSFPYILEDIYTHYALDWTGNLGLVEPFRMSPAPELTGGGMWFGPLGTLLILPAILYALLRGSRRLKGIGLSLMGYCFLVSLVFAWTPTNAKYFSLFFVCGGFTTSYLLPPWRLTRKGRILLIATCLVLMIYSGLDSSGHLF